MKYEKIKNMQIVLSHTVQWRCGVATVGWGSAVLKGREGGCKQRRRERGLLARGRIEGAGSHKQRSDQASIKISIEGSLLPIIPV